MRVTPHFNLDRSGLVMVEYLERSWWCRKARRNVDDFVGDPGDVEWWFLS